MKRLFLIVLLLVLSLNGNFRVLEPDSEIGLVNFELGIRTFQRSTNFIFTLKYLKIDLILKLYILGLLKK